MSAMPHKPNISQHFWVQPELLKPKIPLKFKLIPRKVARAVEECALGITSNKAKPECAARLGQVCPQIKRHLQKKVRDRILQESPAWQTPPPGSQNQSFGSNPEIATTLKAFRALFDNCLPFPHITGWPRRSYKNKEGFFYP